MLFYSLQITIHEPSCNEQTVLIVIFSRMRLLGVLRQLLEAALERPRRWSPRPWKLVHQEGKVNATLLSRSICCDFEKQFQSFRRDDDDGGGRLVVKMRTLYSNDPSSNPV